MSQTGHLYCKCHIKSDDGITATWVARRSRVVRQVLEVGVNVLSKKAEWYYMEDRGYDEQTNSFLVKRDEELRLDSQSGRQRYEEILLEEEEIISVHCRKCGASIDLDRITDQGDALSYVPYPRTRDDVAKLVINIPLHEESEEDDDEEGDEE